MKKLAIFASGNGSNAQNITEHFKGSKNGCISLIISNKPDAYVLERASALGVPAAVLPREQLTAENPAELLALLEANSIDYIILAGYLLKIPAALVEAYPGRIINIHPALLPKFGGKGMYGRHVHQAVIDSAETESGITIHLVDSNYDSGKQEIDVRGMRVDEAVQAITYFIDDAIQFNIKQVRILHGTGTGALRQYIRQYLDSVNGVKSYRDEHVQLGGAGITVVTLE